MIKNRYIFQGFSICLFTAFLFSGIPGIPISSGYADDGIDLTEISIEDLMNINVTSVSKKSQTIAEAAAAVFVITQDDIRRSGATTIPDALRMAPGIQVARIDANKWAVTARGSNGRFANKLLVLMDGRSVYTPIYSGVFWENVDTLLEDIDRIEVIRGPGASLWGANAVNGVINIITKPAEMTKGVLTSISAGTEERENVSLRYGGEIGENTPYRVYVKGFDRDSAADSRGEDTADDWSYLRGGFRIDHQNDSLDHFTVQGDIFAGTNGETITAPIITPPYSTTFNNDHKEKGGNLLARWTRTLSSLSEISLQTYYARNEHILHLGNVFVDTFDVEFQHRFPAGTHHNITWGLGYRLYKDNFEANRDLLSMDPASQSFDIYNAFLQDEIGFFDRRLLLTLGSKLECNDFTQFEIQPNARLLWKPNDMHSAWFSVSRAVRTPSRVENDASALMTVVPPPAMGPLPVAVVFYGSDDFDSEKLTAFELGYRVQPAQSLTLDAALYYNRYEGLRETSTGAPVPAGTPPAYMILAAASSNNTRGNVHGFELAAEWNPLEWVHVRPAYTFMENDIDYSATDILASQDPRHQLSLRTSVNLPRNLECDVWYRHVGEVSDAIGGYETIDVRLGWKCTRNLSLSIVGQNLLNSHHAEFQPEALHTLGTEVERGVYGKIVWTFD
jgi:iron complex outermembrane receptor protein